MDQPLPAQPPTPVRPPVPISRPAGIPLVVVIFGFLVSAVAGYFVGVSANKPIASTVPAPTPIVTTTPTSAISSYLSATPTSSIRLSATPVPVVWKPVQVVTEPTLGMADYTVMVPASWEQIAHSSNFQDTETFEDTPPNFSYQLVIHEERNLNPITGQPFATIRDATQLPYDVPHVTVSGQDAAKVMPRAGSETSYRVVFFSPDRKWIISVQLDTPRDGSKLTEGETIFNRILTEFKFK